MAEEPGKQGASAEPVRRDRIAQLVLWGSFLILGGLLAAAVAIHFLYWKWPSSLASRENAGFAKDLLGVVLPVLGTWVGTVLAFYFARENLEAASRALGAGPDARLAAIKATDAMLPFGQIRGKVQLTASNKEADVKLKALAADLRANKASRVVVTTTESGPTEVVKYVIHDSIIYRTIVGSESAEPTLLDLLDAADESGAQLRTLASAFGTVSRGKTLADCQNLMDGMKGCRDVFITESGLPNESPLGWITDRDIAVKVRAG